VIGYIRLVRPGSVIGPQQNYIQEIQALMWAEGDAWRAARGGHAAPPPPLVWERAPPSRGASLRHVGVDVTLLQGGPAGRRGAAAGAQPLLRMGSSGKARCGEGAAPQQAQQAQQAQQQQAGLYALVVDARGGGGVPMAPPAAGCALLASSSPAVVPGAPLHAPPFAAPVKAPADLSLMQFAREKQRAAYRQPRPLAVPPPGGPTAGGQARALPASATSMAAAAAAYLGRGSAFAQALSHGGLAHAPSLARPPPPMGGHTTPAAATRASYCSGSPGGSYPKAAAPRAGGGAPARAVSLSNAAPRPHYSPAGSSSCSAAAGHSLLSASLLIGRPASQQGAGGGGAGARAALLTPAGFAGPVAVPGRAPSAPRERAGAAAVAARVTLHAGATQAPGRPRYASEGPSVQPAELFMGAWRAAPGAATAAAAAGLLSPGAPPAGAPAARPLSTVMRGLAPNGQPRKVPVAGLLQAPLAGGGGGGGDGGAGSAAAGRLLLGQRSNNFGSYAC
jgi:cell division cycle 14